jgi:CRP/FNR family transcriptional regulator
MTLTEEQHTLLDLAIFKDCDSKDIGRIKQKKKIITFQEGEKIIEENQSAEGVYCLLEGAAKIIRHDTQNKEKIVSLAKEGDILGLRSVIHNKNFSSTAMALVKSSFCFIPKEYITQIIEKCPSVNLKIMISLCKEINEIEEKINSITHKNVVNRIAEILLILFRNYGLDQNNYLRIMLSWDDIASMANVTKNTLTKVLNEFKQKNMIAVCEKKIQIFNHHSLEELSA